MSKVEQAEIIRMAMSILGSSRSPRKVQSSRRNVKVATEAARRAAIRRRKERAKKEALTP
jgi:hypothetical protein